MNHTSSEKGKMREADVDEKAGGEREGADLQALHLPPPRSTLQSALLPPAGRQLSTGIPRSDSVVFGLEDNAQDQMWRGQAVAGVSGTCTFRLTEATV